MYFILSNKNEIDEGKIYLSFKLDDKVEILYGIGGRLTFKNLFILQLYGGNFGFPHTFILCYSLKEAPCGVKVKSKIMISATEVGFKKILPLITFLSTKSAPSAIEALNSLTPLAA